MDNQDVIKQEKHKINANKQSFKPERKNIINTAKNLKANAKDDTEIAKNKENVDKVRKVMSEDSLASYEHLYANPRYNFLKAWLFYI